MAVLPRRRLLRTSTLDRRLVRATRGRGREFDWTRSNCTGGSLLRARATRTRALPGVTQRIAVSGSTAPFTFRCRRRRRERSSFISVRARRHRARVRFDVTPAAASRRTTRARSASLVDRLRVRPGSGVRIVVDVAPLSHPRTGVGNYIRGSLLGLAEAGGHERRRVRAREPARQARDRARARRDRRRALAAGRAGGARAAHRVEPRRQARRRARRRRARRLPLRRLDVSAAAARACARR